MSKKHSIHQNKKGLNTNLSPKVVAIVLSAVLVLVAIPVAYLFMSDRQSKQEKQTSTQQTSYTPIDATPNNTALQFDCLDKAYKDYMSRFNAADTDGDGKVAYADGYTEIQTSYYDAEISCYRIYKTSDSDSYITDLQQKRQQEVDKYNAWVGSLRQTTPTYNQPTHCTSYTYGINDQFTSYNCY